MISQEEIEKLCKHRSDEGKARIKKLAKKVNSAELKANKKDKEFYKAQNDCKKAEEKIIKVSLEYYDACNKEAEMAFEFDEEETSKKEIKRVQENKKKAEEELKSASLDFGRAKKRVTEKEKEWEQAENDYDNASEEFDDIDGGALEGDPLTMWS